MKPPFIDDDSRFAVNSNNESLTVNYFSKALTMYYWACENSVYLIFLFIVN